MDVKTINSESERILIVRTDFIILQNAILHLRVNFDIFGKIDV